MSESSNDGNKGVDFSKMLEDFNNFRKVPLKDRISSARGTVNGYLEHLPSFSIASLKHKTTTEVIEAPLHAASEYFHKEYPFASTVTKNHGYLILLGSLLVGLYPFRRLPLKYSLLAHSATVGLTGTGLGVANFKWNFPKKHE